MRSRDARKTNDKEEIVKRFKAISKAYDKVQKEISDYYEPIIEKMVNKKDIKALQRLIEEIPSHAQVKLFF